MRPKWTEAIIDGFHNVISHYTGANSDPSYTSSKSEPTEHSRPGQQQNSYTLPSTASHASRSTRSWAEMPSQRSATKRKPNGVRDFLKLHDNVECDPIEIESDEEDSHSHYTSRIPSSQQQPRQTRPRTSLTRSESREESKLLPTLSYGAPFPEHHIQTSPAETLRRRREPDATAIQDPMRKPVFSGGHKPVNTLERTSTTSRSNYFQDRTDLCRGNQQPRPSNGSKSSDKQRANDHLLPNKRIKSAHPGNPGTSSAPAFDSYNGQDTDDSPDELGLSPPSKEETRPAHRSQRSRVLNRQNEAMVGRQRLISAKVPTRMSLSPENEDHFTKNSARQRKAEKDGILGHSSPPLEEEHSQQNTSRYFGKSEAISTRHKIQKQDEQRILSGESVYKSQPDACSSSSHRAYKDLRGREGFDKLIQGNTRSTTISKPPGARQKKIISSKISFKLNEVVYSGLHNPHACIVQVDLELKEISIIIEDSLLTEYPIATPFSINKIVQFRYDGESLVSIDFSRSDHSKKIVYLRFLSSEIATAFRDLLLEITSSLNIRSKDHEWMESALEREKNALANPSVPLEGESARVDSPGLSQWPSPKMNTAGKRLRLIDQLDKPTISSRTQTIISGIEHGSGVHPGITVEIPRTRGGVSLQREVPQKPVERAQRSDMQRRTRSSQNREQIETLKALEAEEAPKIPLSATGALGPPWSRDLVYPKPGKRSAIVPFQDLSRLDDDEFLNDNLISFFMQYLETYLETTRPELYKRTYFFNSYFFERLTKNAKGRSINFKAVERWTKSINIFNRDFVVVPVNENLHWYLVIICNLQNLVPPQNEDGDVLEVTPDPKPEIQTHDDPAIDPPQVRSDLLTELGNHDKAPTEETQDSFAGLTISDNESSVAERPPSSPKKGHSKRKQIRRSLPKIPLDKPVIITLDSLGASRSGTCSILKSYIVAEGEAKRNIHLDTLSIKGMTAKGIPTQNNFSDCGLYLCMYLEQFVADPHKFVARILQREESAQMWPSEIRSEDLRSRLRDLILEVHRRQEKQQSEYELPEVGSIMIQRRDPSPKLEAEPPQRTRQDVEAARQRLIGLTQAPQQRPTALPLEDLPDRPNGNKGQFGTQAPIRNEKLITDLRRSRKRSTSPIPDSQQQHIMNDVEANSADVEIPDSATSLNVLSSEPPHSTPGELVASLRHRDEERESHKRQRLREDRAHKRSDSASTDFLTGIDSWANIASPSASSRDDKSKKSYNQRVDVIEIEASPEPQSPPDGGLILPKNRNTGKRKRQDSQTTSELKLTQHPGNSEPQELGHLRREVRPDIEHPQNSGHQKQRQRRLRAMQGHSRSPDQHQPPIEVDGDPEEIEEDAGSGDSDGSMLFQ